MPDLVPVFEQFVSNLRPYADRRVVTRDDASRPAT